MKIFDRCYVCKQIIWPWQHQSLSAGCPTHNICEMIYFTNAMKRYFPNESPDYYEEQIAKRLERQ